MSTSPSLGTLFRLTLASGVAAAVELHLRRGAPLDGRDAHGRTPLMLAAMRGHVDVCRVLLQAGAEADLRDANGDDAAALARAKGHTLVLLLLASQSPPARPDATEAPAAPQDDIEAVAVLSVLSLQEQDAKQREALTPPSLAPPLERSIAAPTTDGRAEPRRASGVLDSGEASDGWVVEEDHGPARMDSDPYDAGPLGSASDAGAEADQRPNAELAGLLVVNEQASPTTPSWPNAAHQPVASASLSVSRGAAPNPRQANDGSTDATGVPSAADALAIEIVPSGSGEAAWEPEPEPDLTHFGVDIAAAAAQRENAVSRHAADLQDADWTDTHIDLPDMAPDWTDAFREGSDGRRAVAHLVSAGLREGWVLAEELDALCESVVDGEKGYRLVVALEILLRDLGILVEDEHAIEWARMGVVESDGLRTSGNAYEVAAAAERLTEIYGALPDAERLLLETAARAPVLSKAAETRVFHELAASLTFLQRGTSSNPLAASCIEKWADQLDARSVLPREISEADWGADDQDDADASDTDQDT